MRKLNDFGAVSGGFAREHQNGTYEVFNDYTGETICRTNSLDEAIRADVAVNGDSVEVIGRDGRSTFYYSK